MEQGTHIPVDVLNANMRKLGRNFEDAVVICHGWQGDQYGLHCTWSDGYADFVGFGVEASAIVDALHRARH